MTNYDYEELPYEIWCDLQEECGVEVEALRALFFLTRPEGQRPLMLYGNGFTYGYGWDDGLGNCCHYSSDTYQDAFYEGPRVSDTLGDGNLGEHPFNDQ